VIASLTVVKGNLKSQAILQALEQQLATFFVAKRADDLATAMRLAKDYSLRALLSLAALIPAHS
jgi:hypothetical protein